MPPLLSLMKDSMDDGEVELSSDHVLLPHSDSFLDELLKNTRTCTHTHTCNPPGPDATHTHTCFHTHTQVIGSEEDDDRNCNNRENSNSKAKRPSGNREAVRKYREKKKAHTAYLEEEVKKLRLLNQQLVRKLQGQAILEAEVLRLRSILVDLRGTIDNELGAFPFQKQCDTTTILKEGTCGLQSANGLTDLQCPTNVPCFRPEVGASTQAAIETTGQLVESWEGNCQPVISDCQANGNDMANGDRHTTETVEALVLSASHA